MLTAAWPDPSQELARPFLHDFLAAVYPFYDIIIWSATSMKWVEVGPVLRRVYEKRLLPCLGLKP